MPAGRPKAEASEREIELLAGVFCTNEEIAAKVGISRSTLERNFDAALKRGRQASKASLRAIQWKHAQKSVPMSIWLGKQYLNQRDRLDLNSITPEQAAAILQADAGEDSE